MLEPVFDAPDREEWDEHDWELFLRRADARTAKYQELFETLLANPQRDRIIAHEMGWEQELKDCGGDAAKCPACEHRFDCEAYEMQRLIAEPEAISDDPDADELMSCFDQLRDIPAYTRSEDFAQRIEDILTAKGLKWTQDEEYAGIIFAAHMVPAQVAGGHGIGYERDSLCGNIANCKRALSNLRGCIEQLPRLLARNALTHDEVGALQDEGKAVTTEVTRWIDSLRARIWWR